MILLSIFNYFIGACILIVFIGAAVSLLGNERKTIYDADFLNASEVLSSWNKGFCLNGKQSLTIKDSFKNAIVFGSTGNYKSSGILIPSILKMRGHCSLVINNPSFELFEKTSGALLEAGYVIKSLTYTAPNLSVGYNPLKRARGSNSGIRKISKMCIGNALGHNSKDPFWNLSAENLTSMCTLFILRHFPEEFHTLANVYHLITAMSHSPELVDKLFVQANDPQLLGEYKSFLSAGKTLDSIIATCRSALSIFGMDENISRITSHDSIDVSEFRKKKIALFINTPVSDMKYFSLITSLFLEQFFGEIMSRPVQKGDLPIFFLIDEASSLYFSGLQTVTSNIRKSSAGVLQIYQSASQLIDLYSIPIARAITENSYAKVYMSGQNINVATELETTLGKFEFLNEKGVRQVRPLLLASEIRELEESLIVCSNKRVIKTKIFPYFNQFWMNRLTKIPPYQPKADLPFQNPPIIKLPD